MTPATSLKRAVNGSQGHPRLCLCKCGKALTGKQEFWASDACKNRVNKLAREKGLRRILSVPSDDMYLFGMELAPEERLRELARAYWGG